MPRIALQRHVLEDKLGQYHCTEKSAGLSAFISTYTPSLTNTRTVFEMWGAVRVYEVGVDVLCRRSVS